jgi:hypothetical protein
VRVAYEAFAGRGTAISSWDPTAVYHAVRPDDALLHEVGPGTNAVASTGANTFTTGAGHQFYLQRAGSAAVASAIEKLLDRLEPLPPPAPPPPDPATAPRAEPPPPAADAQAAPAEAAVAPAARATGPGCVVPTLSGRTLEGARALLRRHRCALGRVTRAKGRTRLRVARQSLVPRRPHRAGTRVAITLR